MTISFEFLPFCECVCAHLEVPVHECADVISQESPIWVCVCVCLCICVCVRLGISLTRSSPSRQGWLAKKLQVLPVSPIEIIRHAPACPVFKCWFWGSNPGPHVSE